MREQQCITQDIRVMKHQQIAPLSKNDEACIKEIKDVLTRHGALHRFGITLLHEHFQLAPTEILVESCNDTKRELFTRPVELSKMEIANTIETSWRLDSEKELAQCIQRCECASNNSEERLF
jgi:hypothetical protein